MRAICRKRCQSGVAGMLRVLFWAALLVGVGLGWFLLCSSSVVSFGLLSVCRIQCAGRLATPGTRSPVVQCAAVPLRAAAHTGGEVFVVSVPRHTSNGTLAH